MQQQAVGRLHLEEEEVLLACTTAVQRLLRKDCLQPSLKR
jgi:hypothetical protein